jgi:hypothetical protein
MNNNNIIINLNKKILLLEQRILELKENPIDFIDVFPVHAQCLHFHLLGEAYLEYATIFPEKVNTSKWISILHDGLQLSVQELDAADCE